METLRDRIIRHEGVSLVPYKDTLGKLTIGVGRCLDTQGISQDEAQYLLDNDIENVVAKVNSSLPWVQSLDDRRRDVLYEMAFQLGINGLLGFKNTLAAINANNWSSASVAMLNSAWHKQTPKRCEELANIILNG